MTTKLRNLKISEVSLVDKGANQGAHVMLWKRAETVTTPAGQQPEPEKPMAEQEKKEEQVETLTTDLASVQKRNADLEKELAQVRTDLQAEVDARNKELEDSKAEVAKIHKQRRRERFIKLCEPLDYLPGTQADDFGEDLDVIESAMGE